MCNLSYTKQSMSERTIDGLRDGHFDSGDFAGEVNTGDLHVFGDISTDGAIRNQNGLMLVNRVTANQPLTVSNTGGTVNASLNIDSDTLTVDGGNLKVSPLYTAQMGVSTRSDGALTLDRDPFTLNNRLSVNVDGTSIVKNASNQLEMNLVAGDSDITVSGNTITSNITVDGITLVKNGSTISGNYSSSQPALLSITGGVISVAGLEAADTANAGAISAVAGDLAATNAALALTDIAVLANSASIGTKQDHHGNLTSLSNNNPTLPKLSVTGDIDMAGVKVATINDVAAATFSTFVNDEWINSDEGFPRFFFVANGDNVFRSGNSVFAFRSADNTTNLLTLDPANSVFRTPVGFEVRPTFAGSGLVTASELDATNAALAATNAELTVTNDHLVVTNANVATNTSDIANKQPRHVNLDALSSTDPVLGTPLTLSRPDTNTAPFAGTILQRYMVGGSTRWQVCTTGETGVDSGSDYTLTAMADNGNWWYDAFKIRRSDGVVHAFKGMTVGNGIHDAPGSLSTVQVLGATTAPHSTAGGGMYHRSGVGLGLFSDYGASLELNGFGEAWRVSPTGITDFKVRPTFNGADIALLSEVVDSMFTTFNNNEWINSADGKGRMYFAANGGSYAKSPTDHRWRVDDSDASDVMVLSGSELWTQIPIRSGGAITLGVDAPLLIGGGYVENKILQAYWDGFKRVMDIYMPGDYRGYGASDPTARMRFTDHDLTVLYTAESTTPGDGALRTLGGLGVAKNANVGGALTVTGASEFKTRPTFNGSDIALLSEVADSMFTTFNNDVWINSAEGQQRLFFASNHWTILNSPTSIGFRTGNASAGPDKMVLDGSGTLELKNTGVSMGYIVGEGSLTRAGATGAYFMDANVGNICLRAEGQPLLLGTSSARNADLRIEPDGTVNFSEKPKVAGTDVATTADVTAQVNAATTSTYAEIASWKTYTWTPVKDYNVGTGSGTLSWQFHHVPMSRGIRYNSHLLFHVRFSAFTPVANATCWLALGIRRVISDTTSGPKFPQPGTYEDNYPILGTTTRTINQANNHQEITLTCSTRDCTDPVATYIRDYGHPTWADLYFQVSTVGWSTVVDQSNLTITIEEVMGDP